MAVNFNGDAHFKREKLPPPLRLAYNRIFPGPPLWLAES
jgi:hypothetical protein